MRRLKHSEKRAYVERGARIRWAIEQAGITQAELAKSLGISQAYISYMCQGEKAGTKHLKNIAKVTGSAFAYLESGTLPEHTLATPIPKKIRAIHVGSSLQKKIGKPVMAFEVSQRHVNNLLGTELFPDESPRRNKRGTHKMRFFLIAINKSMRP